MDRITVERVRELAREAHIGQVDKLGRSYFEVHLEAVAFELSEYGPDAEMAGLLHDILEDTDITVSQLRAAGVPAVVIQAVDAVTKRSNESYEAFIRRAAGDPLGRLVKLADNKVNLASNAALSSIDPETAARLRKKYEHAREILIAAGQNSRRHDGSTRSEK